MKAYEVRDLLRKHTNTVKTRFVLGEVLMLGVLIVFGTYWVPYTTSLFGLPNSLVPLLVWLSGITFYYVYNLDSVRDLLEWWRNKAIGRIAQFHHCGGEHEVKIFKRVKEWKKDPRECDKCGGGWFFSVVLAGWFKSPRRINRIDACQKTGYQSEVLNGSWSVYVDRSVSRSCFFFLEDEQGTRMTVDTELANKMLALSEGDFGGLIPGWRPIIMGALLAREKLLAQEERESRYEAEADCLHEVLYVASKQIRESVRFGRSTEGMRIRQWIDGESVMIRHMDTRQLNEHSGELLQSRV